MTLYFFHMSTRDRKVQDDVGKRCPSLSAAHEHALGLIRSTTRYVDTPRDERWMVEVGSTTGTQLVVLFPVSDRWCGRWDSFSQLQKYRENLLSDGLLDAAHRATE